MKKVSIITPCYNTADTLRRCWDSIRNQSIGLDALECIFVDDASTDDDATWQMLEEIEREAPESVKIIRLQQNMAQGGARNEALKHVTGRYLQFLDADDELLPDACRMLFEYAEKTQADIIQFNHDVQSGTERQTERNCRETGVYHPGSAEGRKLFLIPSGEVTFGCWNKFYRMEMVRKAEACFAEHVIYEEPLFVYPQLLSAECICLLEQSLLINHIHAQSTTAKARRMGGSRVGEHRSVQLQLLQFLQNREAWMRDYYDEIEYYFLWTYFFETILFMGREEQVIPPELFEEMKRTCKRYFPEWKDNPYIRELDAELYNIMAMIDL